MVVDRDARPLVEDEPRVQALGESLSERLLRQAFETVPGAIGFATSEGLGGTRVYLVLADQEAEDAATEAFVRVRRQLRDYSMSFLALDRRAADDLVLRESAHFLAL